ncbi:hypothetical protein RRG08_003986 [Elysia crispata]|uniref:Uncharacterized protein n=1 Tax=Elysia crispata TaxID=231223 RepID=A0AAE1CSX8_9GAST|nr:hypothetical protein RRG08_003986 [Elysia crispata]
MKQCWEKVNKGSELKKSCACEVGKKLESASRGRASTVQLCLCRAILSMYPSIPNTSVDIRITATSASGNTPLVRVSYRTTRRQTDQWTLLIVTCASDHVLECPYDTRRPCLRN